MATEQLAPDLPAPAPAAAALEAVGQALEVLQSCKADNDGELQALLRAIQQACTGMVQLVEGGGRLPTDLLENTLEAVSRGLAAARQHLQQTAGQLQAVQQSDWSVALLSAADACVHSERWHAAWHEDAGAGKEAYSRTVVVTREMLKQDLLPLLCDAAAQMTANSGFCLTAQYQAVLAMGRTAGEIVGMRDPRHRRLNLRNFSVLNALWNGIQKMWTAVPAEVRPDMERQGLGAAGVVSSVLGCLRKDLRSCRRLLEPGMGKLLLYWVQKAAIVLTSYHTAAPACWQGLLEAVLCGEQELALLEEAAAAGGSGGDGSGSSGGAAAGAAALAEALRCKVIPSARRLLANCLGWTATEDQLRVMVDAMRMRLSGSDSSAHAVHVLHTMLHLLHSAPSMPPLARNQCVALLDSVLDALRGNAFAASLGSAQLREQVADAVLVFLAACCHAAATATSNDVLQAWERQLVGQTWERCQQQLFLHALHPHPLTAHVLGCVWSDLAAAADSALVKSHINALHDLLRLAAAAEAGSSHAPPSPLCRQLLTLLACLLGAVPPAMLQIYYGNFLQLLPSARDDPCQLACLAAELRLATLVDGASGSAVGAQQAQQALQQLFALLHEAGPLVMKRLAAASAAAAAGLAEGAAAPGDGGAAVAPAAEAECLYLTWLLEALHCAVAYVSATSIQLEDGGATLSSRVITLLTRTVSKGVFAFAAPCLAILRDLQLCAPLAADELEALLSVLGACQQRPELAAAVAELVPALARCPLPHAEVLHGVLSEQSPLLQHLGIEAFRAYSSICPNKEFVTAALPPTLRNPDTGFAAEALTSVLQQYSQRCGVGSVAPDEQEAAAWAAELRQAALGAAGALRRAAEACRAAAQAAASDNQAGVQQAGPGEQDEDAEEQQQPPHAAHGSGVAEAVQALVASIRQLESAAQAAPGGAAVDAATARVLQHCSARLSQLLASTSV